MMQIKNQFTKDVKYHGLFWAVAILIITLLFWAGFSKVDQVTVAGGKVILASSDKKIRVFNPVDGSLLDDVTVPSGATSNPVIADNVLYFVSRDGDLHAFR